MQWRHWEENRRAAVERASRGAATATTTEKALLRYSKYFEVVENLRECLRKIVEKVERNVGFALLCKKITQKISLKIRESGPS